MKRSLLRSRKAVAKIVAEVFMVLITILMSMTVFLWVVPVFQTTTGSDNGKAAYLESFSTLSGSFALGTRVQDEVVRTSPSAWTPNAVCNAANPLNTPHTGNIYVPVGATCSITAQVTGNVFADSGSTLTVTGTTITGTLNGNYSSSISLLSSHVNTDMNSYSAVNVLISQSTIGGNLYVGNRAIANMTASTVGGMAEFEVNQVATVVNNNIGGQLETEDVNTAQVTLNHAAGLETDGNGAIAVSGNTFGSNGITYGRDSWCAAAGNTASGGTTGTCVGTVRVDVENTGGTTVNLQALYVGRTPSASVSWVLASGQQEMCGSVLQSAACTVLPIVIPTGQTAQLTLVWAPANSGFVMTTVDVPVDLVSTHSNFVHGDLYFGIGLLMPSSSRLLNRVCPPCQ